MTVDQVYWLVVLQIVVPIFVYITLVYLVLVGLVFAIIRLLNKENWHIVQHFEKLRHIQTVLGRHRTQKIQDSTS